MSELIILALVLVLVGTQLYWWRRQRTVEESLTASRAYDTADTVPGTEQMAAAQEAADVLDTSVAELPSRVDAVDAKIRTLQGDCERLRKQWAESWWRAETTDGTDNHVKFTQLTDGSIEDGKALAKETPPACCVVVAIPDDQFVVGVGTEFASSLSAADVADIIVESAGGTGGGADAIAMGTVEDDIRDALDVVSEHAHLQ